MFAFGDRNSSKHSEKTKSDHRFYLVKSRHCLPELQKSQIRIKFVQFCECTILGSPDPKRANFVLNSYSFVNVRFRAPRSQFWGPAFPSPKRAKFVLNSYSFVSVRFRAARIQFLGLARSLVRSLARLLARSLACSIARSLAPLFARSPKKRSHIACENVRRNARSV